MKNGIKKWEQSGKHYEKADTCQSRRQQISFPLMKPFDHARTRTHKASVLSGWHQQTAAGTLFIPERDVSSVTDRHKYPITPSEGLMCVDQRALRQGNRDVQQTADVSNMHKSTGTHATLTDPSLHTEYRRAEKHLGAETLLNIGRYPTENQLTHSQMESCWIWIDLNFTETAASYQNSYGIWLTHCHFFNIRTCWWYYVLVFVDGLIHTRDSRQDYIKQAFYHMEILKVNTEIKTDPNKTSWYIWHYFSDSLMVPQWFMILLVLLRNIYIYILLI